MSFIRGKSRRKESLTLACQKRFCGTKVAVFGLENRPFSRRNKEKATFKMSSDRKDPYSVLSFLGIIVLTTISGMGAMWVVFALPASMVLNKSGQENFVAHGMPILELGGALGFLAGILLAAYIAKANPQAKARLEEKFVSRGDRVRIYSGAPFFVTVFLGQWFERLPSLVGESAFPYVGLGIFLVIVAISLFLYDYIPRRLVVPIGILGWLLTAAVFIGGAIHMSRAWH